MLQPCDPDANIWLLRLSLQCRPDEVDLNLVCELMAQLVTDLRGWGWEDDPTFRWR